MKATELNPLDAEAAFGLARETARLRRLYASLHPGETTNPYEAGPFFRRAVDLRPNGVAYHYALARYLHETGQPEALLPVVQNLARIYPPVHEHLKGEPFWSPRVAAAAEEGLEAAVEDGLARPRAYRALSEFRADEDNLAQAVSQYEKALSEAGTDGSFGSYLHLGGLQLENGQLEEAGARFLQGLAAADDKEKGLERIYRVYKSKGHAAAFQTFLRRAEGELPPSTRTQIFIARTLIDSGRYEEAKATLNALNREQPDAEAYYFLYRIAEKERDLDGMEGLIRKAIALQPRNSKYHLLFARLLAHRNRLDRAEREAGLAIQYAVKPSPGLFRYRASIRLK